MRRKLKRITSKLRLKITLPLLLLAAFGGVYQVVLAKPAAHAKPRIEGQVYVLPKEFLVNLAGERFAKLNVALVLRGHDQLAGAHGGEGAPAPPEGFGPLPQEAVVRDLVTDTITDSTAEQLIQRSGRDALKRRVADRIDAHTDVKVDEVLFTDVAIQ